MVRLTTWLSRVPVIKFRKGGKPGGAPVAAKGGSCPVGAAPVCHDDIYIFFRFNIVKPIPYVTSVFLFIGSSTCRCDEHWGSYT